MGRPYWFREARKGGHMAFITRTPTRPPALSRSARRGGLHRSRSLVALALLAVLLTACGDQDGAAPSDGPGASPAEQAQGTNLTDGCVEDFDPEVDYFPERVSFDHATGVDVEYTNSTKRVEVTRPWQGAEETFTILLVQCGADQPEDAGDADVTIEVPVERVATFSTTMLPPFAMFGRTDTIVAHGGLQYVSTEEVREAADAGDIVEAGEQHGPDIETLLAAEPDVALVSAGIGGDDQRLGIQEAGVPAVPYGDWLEETPLGRAEWLKFVALLLNEEGQAEQRFSEIEQRVQEIAARADELDVGPKVLVGTPFEGVWYMPAGDSFVAQQLERLGADYPWQDTEGTGAIELDIEEVLDQAQDADVWLSAGSVRGTLDDLAAQDERFTNFQAFQDGEVYANDRSMNPEGTGNDYFELGAVRPDLILADIFKILYPEEAQDIEFTFFGKVGELQE